MQADFLTYAVTLYFDEKTSGEIFSLTKELCDVTGNDYMIENSVPPHLTLGMFHVNEANEEKLEKLFAEFVAAAKAKLFSVNSGVTLNLFWTK